MKPRNDPFYHNTLLGCVPGGVFAFQRELPELPVTTPQWPLGEIDRDDR
jgi:hypothetical protein